MEPCLSAELLNHPIYLNLEGLFGLSGFDDSDIKRVQLCVFKRHLV